MNWILFWILLGFAIGNLSGLALYHYEDKKERKEVAKLKHKKIVDWRTDKEFWMWTIMLILFGTAYLVLRLILWIKSLITK